MGNAASDTGYRVLFDANPHPMWVFDRASLRFLAVNDAALRQYGYSREEFLGLTILDIRPEEDAALVAGSVGRSTAAPKIWRHRRRDSSTLLAEVTAHSLDFEGVEARLVLALDVTARERGAEQLRRTNRTLEAILQAAPIGILVFDGQGEIVQTNETARDLLGNEGLEPVAPVLDAVQRGEKTASAEVAVAGGRWTQVAANALETGPGSSGAVVVLTEITERHAESSRLQNELADLEARIRERTLALERSEEELEGFCFSVSHDLRGPLRAIDGFAQMVLSDQGGVLGDEDRDALARIRRAAQRMGELIDGMLTLSRLARAEFEPRNLDLSALVAGVADTLRSAHPDRDIRFEIAPGATTYGDPKLVAMLIERLLENAVKFSSPRDVATIRLVPDGDGWAVEDNGVGFDMAYAAKLFKPFERLHAVSEFAGNGLGLAVAYRVVRRHGGQISAEGEVGRGAVLRFCLPSAENRNV